MARRATLIASKKKESVSETVRLFLAGPYELSSIDQKLNPAAKYPGIIGQAYDALGYDAMMLTPADVAVLGQDMPVALKTWMIPPGKVVSKIIERKNMRIGMVYFPVLATPETTPSASDMEAVRKEALAMRSAVDVIIGISPWGAQAEQAFLDKFNGTSEPLDVLLGGGLGPGNRGILEPNSATAWVRPFPKGKYVSLVRLENIMSQQAESFRKHEPEVRFDVVILDEKTSVDLAMDNLLAPARVGN